MHKNVSVKVCANIENFEERVKWEEKAKTSVSEVDHSMPEWKYDTPWHDLMLI